MTVPQANSLVLLGIDPNNPEYEPIFTISGELDGRCKLAKLIKAKQATRQARTRMQHEVQTAFRKENPIKAEKLSTSKRRDKKNRIVAGKEIHTLCQGRTYHYKPEKKNGTLRTILILTGIYLLALLIAVVVLR